MVRIITRTSLLVLALASTTARAQVNADLDAGKNQTNEKFLGALLGGLLGGAAPAAGAATTAAPAAGAGLLGGSPLVPLLIGGALGSGATIIGQNVLGKPNNNCGGGGGGLNFGRRRRQAEDGSSTDENDPNNKFFFNNNNGCNNPCGRRRRQAGEEGVDKGDKVDTKFFGLFGGGGANTNCGPTGNFNQPQNNNQGFNQGFNNGGFNNNQGGFNNNQGGFNNNGIGFVNNQGFNNNQIICSCSSISKIDNNGQEEAQCRKPDHTGRRWCYTTSNSRCGDAVQSKRNPHNPWSYAACSVATRGDANTSTSSTCACSDISKIENGVEEAQCKKADHTGKAWCYATEGSNCPDAHPSTKYPQNPWSYVACSG